MDRAYTKSQLSQLKLSIPPKMAAQCIQTDTTQFEIVGE